jgi:hypothetical protein
VPVVDVVVETDGADPLAIIELLPMLPIIELLPIIGLLPIDGPVKTMATIEGFAPVWQRSEPGLFAQ